MKHALHEGTINGISAVDDGVYKSLKGELIQLAWDALGRAKQGGDGGIREKLGRTSGGLDVEADIVAGVLHTEGTELVGVAEPGA